MLARWPLRRRLVALVLVLLATVATVIGVSLLVTLAANATWLGTIGTWGYLL